MKKKIVLIGVALLVLAIVFLAIDSTIGIGGSKPTTSNFTVGADNFSYLPVEYNSSIAILAIETLLSSPTNIYILNGSAFSAWSSRIKGNSSADGLAYIEKMGVNSSYVASNRSIATIPISLEGNKVLQNNLTLNKIYVVIDNTHGSKSYATQVNATVSYLTIVSTKVSSTLAISLVFSVGFILLLVAGIIVIVYGILKKDVENAAQGAAKGVSAKEQKDKEYVDQLYKGIKSKKKRSGGDSDSS